MVSKEKYLEAVELYKKAKDEYQKAYYKAIIDEYEKTNKAILNPIDCKRLIGRAPRYYS